MTTRTISTAMAIAAATLTITAAVAGCGSSSSSAPANPAPSASSTASAPAQAHNQGDIAFATGMIPHHAQAVTMSKLAPDHASSAQVKDLATRIEAAQQPEIDQMSGFLRAWNAPVPDTNGSDMGDMPGMNHGSGGAMPGMSHGPGGGMPGMMSSAQMRQLGQAHGAEFDKMFLQMMISHHEGAITMAKTELGSGQNPDARTLAQNIINAQQREITEMQSLLKQG